MTGREHGLISEVTRLQQLVLSRNVLIEELEAEIAEWSDLVEKRDAEIAELRETIRKGSRWHG